MNPNYDQTITLYNCLRAADSQDKKDHWYRHSISGCYYKSVIARSSTGTVAAMQNSYTVRIPASENYRPYWKWVQLSDEDRQKYFTIRMDDIVVARECSDIITGAAGQTAVQVMNRYKPDAFKVTAVSDNTARLMAKHYRLGG